ncbi:MAG: hypothetical protein IKJ01_05110 [Lachnospiraceae bacterium]|nr:hypothetical protein [Lachnospiraceae bacterium]
MSKVEELLSTVKLNEILSKKEDKKLCTAGKILAVVGGIVLIGAAIYGIYRFFAPDYLDDFEDELEDDFDDEDFFEDEDVVVEDVFEE